MNDTELLQALQSVIKQEVDPLREQLAHTNARLDSMEKSTNARFDAMDARMGSMEKSTNARFDAMDSRFDAIDIRMDSMDTRMDSMETSILKTQMTIEGEISDKLNALADGFAGLTERNPKIDRMDTRLENIETKVDVIEAVVTSHSEEINDLRIAK